MMPDATGASGSRRSGAISPITASRRGSISCRASPMSDKVRSSMQRRYFSRNVLSRRPGTAKAKELVGDKTNGMIHKGTWIQRTGGNDEEDEPPHDPEAWGLCRIVRAGHYRAR